MSKVTETNGPRPAGPPDRCFYCDRAIGDDHAADCVCVRKRVRVRFSIERNVTVPDHWTDHDVEFWINESSSCMDNHVNRLADLFERSQSRGRCTCGLVKGEVVK